MMKLIAPALLLTALVLVGCTSSEQAVRDRLAAANYCETDTDCTVVPGRCPFDCYVLTNRSESGAIASLLASYDSDCEYGCIPQPDYRCVAQKCEFKN